MPAAPAQQVISRLMHVLPAGPYVLLATLLAKLAAARPATTNHAHLKMPKTTKLLPHA